MRERVAKYIEKHRDEINARRREKRKMEKVDKEKEPVVPNIVIIKRITKPVETIIKPQSLCNTTISKPAAFLESSTLDFN